MTTDGKTSFNEFRQNTNGLIKDNLIIKGNNLLTLSSILNKFKNKTKLIYIDPPFNTGSDSFKYNDSFNHSTWLTFMKTD
jgi:adenine-specific DNA-methyltransferase